MDPDEFYLDLMYDRSKQYVVTTGSSSTFLVGDKGGGSQLQGSYRSNIKIRLGVY